MTALLFTLAVATGACVAAGAFWVWLDMQKRAFLASPEARAILSGRKTKPPKKGRGRR